jgi:2-methylaconitate cis-trans-isomerase PrpF
MVDIRLETKGSGASMDVVCGALRTARPIMTGQVLVPKSVLETTTARPLAAE